MGDGELVYAFVVDIDTHCECISSKGFKEYTDMQGSWMDRMISLILYTSYVHILYAHILCSY